MKKLLRSKHPEPTPCNSYALFDEHAPEVHPVVFESITADSVRKAALKTRGGAGPSGVDADGWRHILASGNFGNASEKLRSEFAKTIKTSIPWNNEPAPFGSLSAILGKNIFLGGKIVFLKK